MINRYHRFTLVLLLALALFCVTAHYATPAACCISAGASSCSRQNGAPEQNIQIHTCLTCMLETGFRYQQMPQVSALVVTFSKLVFPHVETRIDPLFGVFHPPILSISL
jgi:hypothetical protein